MAIRTQIRLPQITGSLGTGTSQINDQINSGASVATGSIGNADLSETLSYMAAAIKRIHGSDSFTESDAGVFHQSLEFDASVSNATLESKNTSSPLVLASQGTQGIVLGGTTDAKKIRIDTTTDNAVAIRPVGDNGDILLGTTSTGNLSEVARIDGSAGALLMASTKEIHFGDAGEKIVGDGTDLSIDSSNDLNITVVNNLVIDAQGTDANDGASIKLGDANGDTNFRIVDSADATQFTIASNGDTTVGGTLTVNGNLDINGTTTTIDTQNLTIEDSIIGLGVSGSDNSFTNLGDRGIVFAKGVAAHSALPAFYYDGTDDLFQLGKSTTSAASASFIAPTQGNFSTLRLGRAEFSAATDYIGPDPGTGNLTIESGAALVLSSSSDDIIFKDGGQELLTLDSGFSHNLIGSFSISGDNTSTPGKLILKDNDDSDSVTLQAAGDIGTGYALILPTGAGTSGQVLSITGVSGNDVTLGFADQGGAANSSKLVNEVTGPLSAGSALSTVVAADDFDLSAVTDATAPNSVDVYVNGQLLQSSSVAYGSLGGSSAGDYAISGATSAADVKFTFGLEADDTVTLIVRA
jgi:hypothetical protein